MRRRHPARSTRPTFEFSSRARKAAHRRDACRDIQDGVSASPAPALRHVLIGGFTPEASGSARGVRSLFNSAGGTGTYNDPLTFASAEGEFEPCEVIYDPYTRKYLRYEDYCQACTDDWANGKIRHLDVWTGSTTVNGGDTQIQCENDLTPAENSQTIVRKPASNLPVDSECS